MAVYLRLPPGSEGTSVPAGQPMEPTHAGASANGAAGEAEESTAEAWLSEAWAI
jgi:hypothetical protein